MKIFKLPISLLIFSLFLVGGCQREQKFKIGVSQCSDDDWRELMNEEIEREMMLHPDAEVEIRSASDSSEKQIADIRYFIDNGFDIIVAAPNEADALTPVISEAYEQGIPVLIFDRNINGNSYTAFQGADNAEIGGQAASYALKLLPDGGKIIELQGLTSSTPAIERGRGFREKIENSPSGAKIVASAEAKWNYDEAVRITDSLLTLYPDVNLIYAHNDRMALGASDVARKKGLKPHIIGIDAAPQIGMKAVEEGKIDATFLYPTEGHRLVRTALAILKGEPYDTTILLPVLSPVEKSNVDILLLQNEQLKEESAQMKELKKEIDAYWSEHNSQTALLYSAIAILILVCITLFLVLRTFWAHRRHQAQLLEKNRLLEEQRDLEKELNRQLAAATQSKLVFFTNVSHDLRTPLTLIAEPVEQLARASNLTEQQTMLMKIADRNVKILRRLINQILDFRKYENGKMECKFEEARVKPLMMDWGEAFKALSRKQHIDFNINLELPDDFTMALDLEKTERMVFNLLSNAFKFTPAKGAVGFNTSLEGDFLKLVVSDSGRGISPENMENIFDRFYQAGEVYPEGTGIGLSLVKAFVDLLGGNISVESEEGKGTVFTILLPVTHVENKVSDERVERSAESARTVVEEIEESQKSEPEVPQIDDNDSRPLLLVIDDNEDLRMLVKELMKESYRVITASTGKEGIRLASRYVPDLVVCDVMMPEMDGLECCARIKEEVTTSHIPVLMLTACSMDEQRVQGYESGADGYMSKPFNGEVLKARVKSLIENRKRIREISETPVRQDSENEFYSKFLGIVNAQMGNPDLSVDSLADQMGMGRSQFYRKIKALTGFSPVEILRNLRLKKARDLLAGTDKSVSEIAYAVGFSNPAYFTKCYREVYSETPTAMREKLR